MTFLPLKSGLESQRERSEKGKKAFKSDIMRTLYPPRLMMSYEKGSDIMYTDSQSKRIKNIPKARIFHVIGALNVGGAEKYLARLANSLDREKFNLWIVHTNGDSIVRELSENVKVIKLQERKATAMNPLDWLNVVRFRRLMRNLNIDLVNTHGAGIFCIAAWIAAKSLKIPVVHTIQHVYAVRSKTEDLTIKIPGLRHFLYSLVDIYIAFCVYMKNEFVNLWKIPPQKIYLNPLGVDLNKFKPLPETKIKLRQELSIESDAPIIGVVARLSPVKGVHKGIRILSRIREEIPNVKLIIVGDGPMKGEYEKLVTDLNLRKNVVFTGFRNDIPHLMNIFDIYLQTTDAPLLGNTTLEAMAVGKPIVTIVQNKVEEAMARETVIEGYNGILIPLNHPEAVTRLIKLLKDKKTLDEMGKASRRLAEEKFDWNLHVENMEKLYMDLIYASRKHKRIF